MKRKIALFLLLIFTAGLFAGCGGGTGSIGGTPGPDNPGLVSYLFFIRTVRRAEVALTVQSTGSEIAGEDELINYAPLTLTVPAGVVYNLVPTSGELTASNYWFGNIDLENHGPIVDPFTETGQRQVTTGDLALGEPLNGTYVGTVSYMSKDLEVTEGSYLPAISENDLYTGTGGANFNVVNGDTLTLRNQTNASLRYFCLIYDGVTTSTVDNYWTSFDVRTIDWLDVEHVKSTFFEQQAGNANGDVTFTVPGGMLNQGSNNLYVFIYAIDTGATSTDVNDDFRSMITVSTMLEAVLSGI